MDDVCDRLALVEQVDTPLFVQRNIPDLYSLQPQLRIHEEQLLLFSKRLDYPYIPALLW